MSRLIFGHIVNHREPKGSRFVLEAVHEARLTGADFGFIFAERVSHDLAMQIYREIHVLLEQFTIGWYGSQAVECMAMGIPVVVWIRSEDLKFIPEDMAKELPFIFASRQHLKDVILKILKLKPRELEEIRQRGLDFVYKWHDPRKISEWMIPSE